MASITDMISKDTMALRLTQLLSAEEIIAALSIRYKEIKKPTIVTAVGAIFATALPVPEPVVPQPVAPQPVAIPEAVVRIITVPDASPSEEDTSSMSSTSSRERQIPADEHRCCARVFYEKEHLENGKIKKMRDDPMNCYGDRCKFKRSGTTTFCKHHEEKRQFGLWNSTYEGKLQYSIIYKQ
jgi:hypothetical protein